MEDWMGFVLEKIIFPLVGVIWWQLNRRLDKIERAHGVAKEELQSAIDAVDATRATQNADQYIKIHKQNDEIANLRAHMAEKFMMKDDYDRLERKAINDK